MWRLNVLDAATGTDPVARRIVRALVIAVFVQGLGASAVLPLLPLYLRAHGTSTGLVGAVMGSFFFAGVLTQYAAGHLTDRVGHRPVIVGGLGLYAAASLGFIAAVGAGGYLVLRSLQGVGSGAVQVATFAVVGLVVAPERRGRAFALIFAAQLAGMAIGPLAGSVAGVSNLRWLFVATAAASIAAAVPVVTRATVGEGTPSSHKAADTASLVITPALVGVALVGVATGLVTGVYEACWSLLMHSRGAADWQIGLSWTLFALPFAVFAPLAGRLADHLDRRWLAAAAVIASCAFAATYPFLTSVSWLLGLGTAEAIATVAAYPAAQSLLTEAATPETLGRAQGFFTTAQTASIAAAAAVGGAMFAGARWLPFVTAGALGAALMAVLPLLWRGLNGHAARPTDLPVPPPAELRA
jgi:MFS family permease